MTGSGPFPGAAMQYHQRGWPPIPLCWPVDNRCGCGRDHDDKNAGKAPVIAWTELVSSPPGPHEIRNWIREYPLANIGVLLEPARLLVVDCDNDDALGEATAHGLPPAPVVATARGRHFYYRRQDDVPAARTTKRGRARALDVLTAGVLVVPPSLHRSGPRYRWIVDTDWHPVNEAPAWCGELLSTASAEGAAAAPATLPDTLIPQHLDELAVSRRLKALIIDGCAVDPARYPSRSEALFAVLEALIMAGYDDATIAAVILDERHAVGEKPRQLGRRWLAHEIGRARAKCRVGVLVP